MLIFYYSLAVLSGILYLAFVVWMCIESFKVAAWWPVVILFTCGIGITVFKFLHRDKATKPIRYLLTPVLLCRVIMWLLPSDAIAKEKEEAAAAMEKALAQMVVTNGAPAGAESQAPMVADAGAPAAEPQAAAPAPRPKSPKSRPPPASTQVEPPASAPTPTVSPVPAPATGPTPTPIVEAPAAKKPTVEITRSELVRTEESGSVELEVANTAPSALTEVKLSLVYLDQRGARIREWKTIRKLDPSVAASNGKGHFTELAMKLPPNAVRVRSTILSARFADGTLVEY